MIKLTKVSIEEKNVLQNLLEFYVYEFSPYLQLDVSSEGKFGFDQIDQYFSNQNFFPYFIYYKEKLAGFCIVEKVENSDYNYRVDQFFILKRYEGKGIGTEAVIRIFDKYKGKWQITQTETNYRAQAFWRKVIKSYTNNEFDEYYDNKRRSVQTFSN